MSISDFPSAVFVGTSWLITHLHLQRLGLSDIGSIVSLVYLNREAFVISKMNSVSCKDSAFCDFEVGALTICTPPSTGSCIYVEFKDSKLFCCQWYNQNYMQLWCCHLSLTYGQMLKSLSPTQIDIYPNSSK